MERTNFHKTQKYEDSILHKTFGEVIGKIIQETKKDIFDDIENHFRSGTFMKACETYKITAFGTDWEELKEHHLSTLSKRQRSLIGDKRKPCEVSHIAK